MVSISVRLRRWSEIGLTRTTSASVSKGERPIIRRRLRRAEFVSSILEEFGFRAEIKEDGVFSRIEGFDETVMKDKLKLLGYMLMHTRQLDMIMSNDAAYQHHRNKIINDIHSILGSAPIMAEC